MIFTTMWVTHTHSLYRCCINICYYADTGLTTNEQWTYFGPWQKAFPFSKTSRPAVGPTQPPIRWLPGCRVGSAFHPGHGADYSFPSSAEVKNAWSYISTLSHAFVTRCLNWAQKLFLNNFRWKEEMWLGTVVCPATLPVWWRAPAHFSASRTGGKTSCRVHRVTCPDIPPPPTAPTTVVQFLCPRNVSPWNALRYGTSYELDVRSRYSGGRCYRERKCAGESWRSVVTDMGGEIKLDATDKTRSTRREFVENFS
jgi:hypothetical protein